MRAADVDHNYGHAHRDVKPENVLSRLEEAVEESWRKRNRPSQIQRLGPVEDEADWKRGARKGLLSKPEDIPGLLKSAELSRALEAVPLRHALTDQEKAQQASERHLAYLRKNGVAS